MHASRLLSILLRLQSEGCVSARELARAHEVSVRTIYRDVDALAAAGVPIYAEKGRHGGFRLVEGYRTRLTGLDRPEAESLFLAGVPCAAEQLGLGAALERARGKLYAALPAASVQAAQRVAQRFHVDPVPWFRTPDEQALLPELALAVWNGHWLRLCYAGAQGESERRVAPLGLVLKAGTWYLVGAVGDEPRTYRVGSIRALTVESECAPVPRDFALAAYWRRCTQEYEARLQTLRARVRASPHGLQRLARASALLARAAAEARAPDARGWRELELPFETREAGLELLLGLAGEVEVLEPLELRAALRSAARVLLDLYADCAEAKG